MHFHSSKNPSQSNRRPQPAAGSPPIPSALRNFWNLKTAALQNVSTQRIPPRGTRTVCTRARWFKPRHRINRYTASRDRDTCNGIRVIAAYRTANYRREVALIIRICAIRDCEINENTRSLYNIVASRFYFDKSSRSSLFQFRRRFREVKLRKLQLIVAFVVILELSDFVVDNILF